jgi:hypothetical protein
MVLTNNNKKALIPLYLPLGQAQSLTGTRTVHVPVVPPILSYFNLNMKVAKRATNLSTTL